MICYRDRTWCSSSKGCASECYRNLTREHEARAQELGLDVCFADLKGTNSCPGFIDKEETPIQGRA